MSVVRRAAGPGAGGVVSRPGLWERLGFARVTMLSAPPGSGKTVLLRSWIAEAGLAERAGWVTVSRGDPQQFWLAVLDALRQTIPGSVLVGALTAAPDLDGWAIVERLLKDLAPLDEPLWLVIDDLQELGSDQARQQLELLLMRAPDELRFLLATRHDLQLGLHRLRLEGELAEIRADDLRFTRAEAGELLTAAGPELAEVGHRRPRDRAVVYQRLDHVPQDRPQPADGPDVRKVPARQARSLEAPPGLGAAIRRQEIVRHGRSGRRDGIDEIHGDNELAHNGQPAAAGSAYCRAGIIDIRDFDKCHEFFETLSPCRRHK
jgi:hypothetical protein